MTPEESFNQEVWWTLQEIKKEQLATPRKQRLYFKFRPTLKKTKHVMTVVPSVDMQRKIIEKLEEWKALDAEIYYGPFGNELVSEPVGFYLEIHHSRFNDLYALYKNSLAQEVSADRLTKMVAELVHPLGRDDDMTFEIWQLIKGKKPVIEPKKESGKIEELDFNRINFSQALFVLRVMYLKLLDILNCFSNRNFIISDGTLNYFYVALKTDIESVLKQSDFKELKDAYENVYLFESLVGNIENADVEWENGGHQRAYALLGKIENLYIAKGAKTYKLPKSMENNLKKADIAIQKHIDYDNELWEESKKKIRQTDIYKAMHPDERQKSNLHPVAQKDLFFEIALSELCKQALKTKNPNDLMNGQVSLGALNESVDDSNETSEKIRAIELLKSEGIVTLYEIGQGKERIFYINKTEDKREEYVMDVKMAYCQFYPGKLLDFVKERFEPTKKLLENLSEVYLKLIKIVEVNFREPVTRDVKLNNFYVKIVEQVRDLVHRADISPLTMDCEIPFTTLFAAQKHMDAAKTNIQTIINEMYDFYGYIQTLMELYTVGEEKTEDIQELDDYLNALAAGKMKKDQSDDNGIANGKIEIFISEDEGVYRDKVSKKPNYPVKKKRAKLIWSLRADKLSGSQLASILGETVSLVSREVDEINEKCREKLGLTEDFIVRVDTGGYKLNRDKFVVEFVNQTENTFA